MSLQILRKTVRATGGTQVSEYAAKIKSVTSSTDVGAVFLYDTSQDSDGGAWRKKTSHTSWAREGSSTTRSARSEFPAMSLIVADTETVGSVYGTISIYDLDDPSMPLWRSFDNGVNNTFNGLYALNGRIYATAATGTQAGGLYHYNLVEDWSGRQTDNTTSWGYASPLASGSSINNAGFFSGLVDPSVNDVAATWLEGGELDSMGLVRPVIALATDGGVSVIHPSGDVYDIAGTQTHNDIGNVFFTDDQKVGFSYEASGSTDKKSFAAIEPIPFADKSHSGVSWASEKFNSTVSSVIYGVAATTNTYGSGNSVIGAVTPMSNNGLAIGYPDRLTVIKRNTGNDAEAMVSYHTSDYATGYMVGDIRFAGLANSRTVDRSVKGNDLALTEASSGNITETAVATGAELKYYSGFSADDYLSLAYTSDLDFTNTMSVMFWVKDYGNGGDVYGIGTRSSTLSQSLYIDGGYDYRWTLTSDGTTEQQFEFPESAILDEWTFVCFTMNAGSVRGYKNAQNVALNDGDGSTPATTFTGNIFSQATDTEGLEIGKGPIASAGSSGGKLSLFRISATAPTPQQIKEIYEAEKPLFAANAKCLLAASQVNDLAYDKTSGLLHVASESTASSKSFRGLEAVESLTSDGSLGLTAATEVDGITAAGGVIAAYDNAKAGVNLPSIDVRASLLEGESKIPDDGKLHFSGVTTDATPTVIGFIPMAENEWYSVRARVTSIRHNNMTASAYHTTAIEETFYRNIGGDINSRGQISKLTDEITASLDFDLTTTTAGGDSPASVAASSNYIMLRVTGYSALNIQWKASVEVQRISDKTYER